MNFLHEILSDYTLRTVLLGTLFLGASSGILGCFALLRSQSLLGDAISHAALPGIALMFLIFQIKDPSLLLLGALISGLVGAFLIQGIIKNTVLKSDAALGLILSLFFGFGILLLTFIQKMPNANQAGLDKFIFGQAATLLEKDVWVIGGYFFISILLIILFWQAIKLFLFDGDFARSMGQNNRWMEALITGLIVGNIVLGLQTVGVVLMSALLLAPAAAARQWTQSLSGMVWLSALFGGLSGVLGTYLSTMGGQLSTGPVIVLVAASFVFISFVFSPRRGILFKQIRKYQSRQDLKEQGTLQLMYEIARTHEDFSHPHSVKLLNQLRGYSKLALQKLEKKAYILLEKDEWQLTEKGFLKAKNYLKNE